MDIHITKDRIPVVCHDRNLIRLCGVNKNVDSFNYNELPPLQSKVELHYSADIYETKPGEELRIPKLEDVMKEFPDTPINMELKMDDHDLKVEVLKLIRKYKREQITIWGSIKQAHMDSMIRMGPDIPTFTPLGTIAKIFIFFVIGYLPFYNIPYDTFQFPYVNADYVHDVMTGEASNFKKKIKISALRLYNKFNKLIFYHLRQRRIFVFFYNINDEAGFDEVVEKGIDGIITDTPGALIEYVSKKQN
jgi:glycerophosphoryl diester phosphodiesterase